MKKIVTIELDAYGPSEADLQYLLLRIASDICDYAERQKDHSWNRNVDISWDESIPANLTIQTNLKDLLKL